MAYDFQVVVDCAEPHTLADWWAEAIGWDAQPAPWGFIRKRGGGGVGTAADTPTHNGVLVWREGQAIRRPDGSGRRILFQLVPEPKTVKNRIHLDIRVGPEQVEAETERLVGLGATFLHRGQQGPHSWITIADPEGNE